MSDLPLVTRVVLFNDKRAFGLLVDKYQLKVRSLFLKLSSGDHSLADDLAQETFIRVYLKIQTLKVASHFGTWLYRIAYNVYVEHTRRHKQYDELSENENHSIVSDSDTTLDINTAMASLREEERVCISMSYIEGFAHKDIAKVTGLPLGTIKTHINRGKTKLKNFLKGGSYE